MGRQEDVGLSGITDGEFRRLFFHIDFLEALDGVNVTYGDFFAHFRRDDGTEVGFRPPTMRVEEPLRHSQPIQGPGFDFLASVVTKTPKVSIPAPSMLQFRGGREAMGGVAASQTLARGATPRPDRVATAETVVPPYLPGLRPGRDLSYVVGYCRDQDTFHKGDLP